MLMESLLDQAKGAELQWQSAMETWTGQREEGKQTPQPSLTAAKVSPPLQTEVM